MDSEQALTHMKEFTVAEMNGGSGINGCLPYHNGEVLA